MPQAESTLPVIVMMAASVLAVLVAAFAWPRRRAPGGFCFVLLMLAVAVFAFTSASELGAQTRAVKIAWSKISYLGIVNVAPLWLLFAASYGQHSAWLTRKRVAALWLLPLLILGLAATNDWHGLIWPTITPVSDEAGSRLIYGHGLGFWVHTTYAYALIFIGTVWIAQTFWRAPVLYRRQAAMILIAALLPWLANILYVFRLNPWPGLELTPLAFLLTGLVIAWNLYRYQLLDLAPAARGIVFDGIDDGVVVLDSQNRIIDLNPTVCRWMHVGEEVIGRNVFEVFRLDETLYQYVQLAEFQTELAFGQGAARRVYKLTGSPLRSAHRGIQGQVIILHDLSQERALLEAERRRLRQAELLNAITRTALSIHDFRQMLQTLADHLGELFEADGAYLTLWDETLGRTVTAAAYGEMRTVYPTLKPEPGEKTITESVLTAGHVLVIGDAYDSPYLSQRIAALFPTRSILALPMIAGGQKLGAAIISYHQIRPFAPDEITLGEQAAGQIALAVAKTKLLDAETHRAAYLVALQSVSQAVVSSLDLNQIFETVVQVLHQTFGYHYISIYRLDGEVLRLGAQLGYPEVLIYYEIPISQGILGRTVRTRQPQFIRDVAREPDFLCAAYDVESEISVPLLKEGKVLGTINIESPPSHPLSEADLNLLITFGAQVAVAIDNASLFEAERSQRQMAEALREIGSALSESLDFETVLDHLLDGIRQVVPYDSACVMLMDEQRQSARVTRLTGYDRFGVEQTTWTHALKFEVASTANLREMVETGQPLIIPDVTAYPGWIKDDHLSHIRSWAGAPIIVQGRVTAFFSLDKIEPGFYRPEHIERLSAFAGQAAIAIENARLYTELQQQAIREQVLYAATRDFTARLGEEAVLRAIVEHMVRALGGVGCTISRWDPAKDVVVTLLDYGLDTKYLLDAPQEVYALKDFPVTRSVIENRRPIYLRADDLDADEAERAVLTRFRNETVLMLPLVAGKSAQVLGIIELFGRAGARSLSEDDVELAQSLAAQAAAAIENARLYEEVQRLAIVDELTGLYNRRGFFELGRREFDRADRFERPLAALFLDIDHFKLFNDRYSYTVGDQVLRLLAGCLRDNLRDIDLIGRYGGEEFVVLLPETDIPAGKAAAERLRSAVEALQVETMQGWAGFTVSIGLCEKTTELSDMEKLLERAGLALHEAKRKGRNRVAIRCKGS